MKNSGIEWIGEIPDTWELVRFKDICANKKEVVGSNSADYERLALTLNGVIKRPKDDSEGLQPKEFDGYQIIHENDFIFKMIDLQNISTSRVGLSPYTGLVSPAYIRFVPRKENQYNKFTYYFLMSMYYNCVYNSLGGNGVRSALNATDMGQFKIPYPSLEAQKKIVSFLEEKFVAVDELIANQQGQIEKLKEYKQSVITEAVTKGLDKSAPLKDSGIEWIGEIPAHWGIVLLSSLFVEHKHKNIGMQCNNLLSLSYGKIKRKDINGNDGLLPESFEGYNVIGEGDIVLRLTDLQNDQRSLRTGLCGEEGIVTSAYVTLRKRNENLNPKYMYYYLHSFDINKGFYAMGSGVRQGLNYEGIRKLEMLFPSIEEQRTIVEFLEVKCEKIDNLISLKEEKIEKLQEYKKSLIYEYVTGKKEVVC